MRASSWGLCATLFVASLAPSVVGCGSHSLPPMNVVGVDKSKASSKTINYLGGVPLRSGQLLVTESPDSTSFVFVFIPEKFYPFTHVAVISIEDGEPWVYDVTGEVKTFPLKKRLMDNVKGKMYRRRFYEYVAPNLHAEVYEPPEGADGEKLAAFVRQKYAEGVEFDSYFDPNDHSKLFCSELVSLAIAHAGGKPPGLDPSNPNPSVVEGMRWLGVPPGIALPAGKFIDEKRFVGAFGQFRTRTQAWAYFEAKRELFRRFTRDQRLGYMLILQSSGQVEVRPEIGDFVFGAARLFKGEEGLPPPGDPRIEAEVRKLADKMFGPFPASAAPSSPAQSTAAAPAQSATP